VKPLRREKMVHQSNRAIWARPIALALNVMELDGGPKENGGELQGWPMTWRGDCVRAL
jgi:hypothetical protein